MQYGVTLPDVEARTLAEAGSSTEESMTPADVVAMKAFVQERRTLATPFDIIWEGDTPGDNPEKAREIVRPWAEAGVTWWLESVWHDPETQGGLDGMRTRVKQGPPDLEK